MQNLGAVRVQFTVLWMRNNRFEMVLVLDIRDDVERIGGREPSQATPIVSGTKVIKTGFGIAFFAGRTKCTKRRTVSHTKAFASYQY